MSIAPVSPPFHAIYILRFRPTTWFHQSLYRCHKRRDLSGRAILADFAHNSATLGALVDQRLQLSSRIRCSGLLSPEAADFVLELADAGSGLLGAGRGLFGAG